MRYESIGMGAKESIKPNRYQKRLRQTPALAKVLTIMILPRERKLSQLTH